MTIPNPLPPLDEESYERLKLDIEAHGVLDSVETCSDCALKQGLFHAVLDLGGLVSFVGAPEDDDADDDPAAMTLEQELEWRG